MNDFFYMSYALINFLKLNRVWFLFSKYSWFVRFTLFWLRLLVLLINLLFEFIYNDFFMYDASIWCRCSNFIRTCVPSFFEVPQMANTKTVSTDESFKFSIFSFFFICPMMIIKTHRKSCKSLYSWIYRWLSHRLGIQSIEGYHAVGRSASQLIWSFHVCKTSHRTTIGNFNFSFNLHSHCIPDFYISVHSSCCITNIFYVFLFFFLILFNVIRLNNYNWCYRFLMTCFGLWFWRV